MKTNDFPPQNFLLVADIITAPERLLLLIGIVAFYSLTAAFHLPVWYSIYKLCLRLLIINHYLKSHSLVASFLTKGSLLFPLAAEFHRNLGLLS